MRVGVVGTLVWDTIWHPAAAEAREQWGGLTYSLASLAAALPRGWEVVPIVKVGEDLADAALDFLGSMPGLDLAAGVRVVPEPNNRVELHYRDVDHRHEVQRGAVPGWRWEELAPAVASLDALYVNFLSGYELDLATTERLRAAFAGPIHTDLHSLFLGPPTGGPRTPRHLPHWRRWLACFDTVQLNETEMRLLIDDTPEPWDFAAELPRLGPRLVAVTRGGEGAWYAHLDGEPPRVRTGDVAVPGGPRPGDPTGCGDVWGGALFLSLLEGRAVPNAIRRAHRLAAAKVECTSTFRLYDALRAAAAAGER